MDRGWTGLALHIGVLVSGNPVGRSVVFLTKAGKSQRGDYAKALSSAAGSAALAPRRLDMRKKRLGQSP